MTNASLQLNAPKYAAVNVGPINAQQIRKLCGSEYRVFETRATRGFCRLTRLQSWPYKGSHKTRPKFTNVAWITSYATVSEDMLTLHHALHGTRVLRAPAGMFFAADVALGVMLTRHSDQMDYHPGFEELWSKNFATRVRRGMAENFRQRAAIRKSDKLAARDKRESERQQKFFLRDVPSVVVSLADSRRAGNCVEGSLAFAERRLGISRQDILAGAHLFLYPAAKLLSKSEGDPRAMRAVRAAWQRETAVAI